MSLLTCAVRHTATGQRQAGLQRVGRPPRWTGGDAPATGPAWLRLRGRKAAASFTFLLQLRETLQHGHPLHLFTIFVGTVWILWAVKVLLSRRYRPRTAPTALPPASSSRWWTSRSSCSRRCCGGSASRRRTRPSWSSTAPQPGPRGRLQRIRRSAHLDLDASGEQAQRGPDRRRDGLGRGRRAARQRHHLDRGHPGRAAQAVHRPPAWAA
jgi:hypothetical protein